MTQQRLERYATTYFTGTQASIWVGDIWVDECFGVQIQASQSIIPVWGYASRHFDAVGLGKVLVQGAFEINFVDEGYLIAILSNAYLRRKSQDALVDVKGVREIPEGLLGDLDAFQATSVEAVGSSTDLGVIMNRLQVLKEVQELRTGDPEERARLDRDRDLTMGDILQRLGNLSVAQVDQLGREVAKDVNQAAITENVIYRAIPFNLTGHFGNPHLNGKEQGTFKEIRDCFLTTNRMIIVDNDEPVRERYEFIARMHI